MSQNAIQFRHEFVPTSLLFRRIGIAIREVALFKYGHMKNSLTDLQCLRHFGVVGLTKAIVSLPVVCSYFYLLLQISTALYTNSMKIMLFLHGELEEEV